MSKTNKQQSQQSKVKPDVVFDDELDEDFVDNVSKTSKNDLNKIVDSFDNPKGVEEEDNNNLTFGPDLDPEQIEKMRKHMQSLPRDQLMALLSNMVQQKDFGLGENDFSAVSGSRRDDARSRLQAKLQQQRNARQPKSVRTQQYTREQAKNTILREKENTSTNIETGESGDTVNTVDTVENVDDIENLDEPHDVDTHVHSASCSHGPVTSLDRQPPIGKRRDNGLRLGELENDAILDANAVVDDLEPLEKQTPLMKKPNRKAIRAANKRKIGKK
jgi:hypothetical protein